MPRSCAFFAGAANRQRITPPWLHFSILTPPTTQMRVGLEIAYPTRLYGLPLPWRSRIWEWHEAWATDLSGERCDKQLPFWMRASTERHSIA